MEAVVRRTPAGKGMRMRCLDLGAALAALGMWCASAHADVVHLKNGNRLEGVVTAEGDAYRIESEKGVVTVKKEEVLRVEKKDYALPASVRKRLPRLGESFSHPFFGFKILLPKQWQRAPEKEPQKITFFGPKEHIYTPHMDLTIRATQQQVPDVVAGLKGAYQKNYKDVSFHAEDASAVRGRTAYRFVVAFRDGDVKMRTLWTLVHWEDRIYTMGFSCTDAWFDKYHAAVDASMRSLRLFPLPSAPMEKRKEFDALYKQGYDLAKQGKNSEALKAFLGASALIPEFPDIHAIVGQLQLKTKNTKEAEAAFKRALALQPEDYDYNFNLGVLYLHLQRFDDAIAYLAGATKAEPDMEPALTNLAVAYLGKEQVPKAVEVLQQALAADPESVAAHYNLGMAFEKLGKKKEAEAEFREALKLDPKHQGAKDGLARLKK